MTVITAHLRHDIPIFIARLGRLDAHQHQIFLPFRGPGTQLLQHPEEGIVDIRVDGADDDSFGLGDVLDVVKVGGCERDRREGVAAARLHRNADVGAELVMNGGHLRPRGRDRHLRVAVERPDRLVHALHHRLIGAVRLLKNLDELLRADVIGERPETLPRAAG